MKLRYRLDQLEYTEPLSNDSVDLVMRLLSDLVQTTHTSRIYKTQLDAALKEQDAIREQVDPLKQELVRITQENNHLHTDLIKMADQRDATKRQTVATSRKLETAIHELKFMNSQLKANCKSAQQDATKSRQMVEDLFRKFNIVQPEGAGRIGQGSKQNKLFQRLQKIDIETGLGILN